MRIGAPHTRSFWVVSGASIELPSLKLRRSPDGEQLQQLQRPLVVTKRADLSRHLKNLWNRILASGFVWISWPKKSSKVASEVTEDVVRELALPLGWVDVKACAVSGVWSGLKLVIRKELR